MKQVGSEAWTWTWCWFQVPAVLRLDSEETDVSWLLVRPETAVARVPDVGGVIVLILDQINQMKLLKAN